MHFCKRLSLSDCITHKVVKNHGERPMYLVTDHHEPIIDRDTYNRVQQELARRIQKEKYQIKQLRNKENTAANMHLPNCLSAETAARLTAEQLDGKREKANSLAVHKPTGTRKKVLSRFAYDKGRTAPQSYNSCDK